MCMACRVKRGTAAAAAYEMGIVLLGVEKYTRPYLDPRLDLKEFPTAISFASATSGYDPYTANKTNALQLFKQIDIFKEYKLRLENAIGKKKADSQIEQAIFYVNAGSDDFAFTYFHDGIGQPNKNPRDYEQFLLLFIRRFFKVWILQPFNSNA
ncbi:hypothetical protein C3L33_10095, partial [Rhododendron williamsianum]